VTLPHTVCLPGCTRSVQMAVIVPLTVVDIEHKHMPDVAHELFHDRKTFRAARWEVFRVALALSPSDRARMLASSARASAQTGSFPGNSGGSVMQVFSAAVSQTIRADMGGAGQHSGRYEEPLAVLRILYPAWRPAPEGLVVRGARDCAVLLNALICGPLPPFGWPVKLPLEWPQYSGT